MTLREAGDLPAFPPSVALELVKRACELPDDVGRSLSIWTCAELARALKEAEVVQTISPQSVQRILESQKLKPWRVHHWLSSKVPRDEAFYAQVMVVRDLYTRVLEPHECVLSLDEKTSIQPRTGEVTGIFRRRKRQLEFLELLAKIDAETPAHIAKIHLVCDNVSIHKGKISRTWLAAHPRFTMHFTPVHCSWMNQVEQWFSILQRKRLVAPNFKDLAALEAKLTDFIAAWNAEAHPFKWTPTSFDKVLAGRAKNFAPALPDRVAA